MFADRLALFLGIALLCVSGLGVFAAEDHTARRRQLIDEIKSDFRVTAAETGRAELNPAVAETMAKVPRHEFVPAERRDQAYQNRPLPIGFGQTISQPYIVALMTDLLDPEKDNVVLEIGTGSGYQAAILAELVDRVYTIEIIEELGRQASQRLQRLGYDNVTTRIGDGYYGWEEQAPFDGIVVTAAASYIPPPLVHQLKSGGRMIIPVGSAFLTQYLVLVEKDTAGTVTTRQLLPVRFVPLTGGH